MLNMSSTDLHVNSTLGFKMSLYYFALVTIMGILNAFDFWDLFGLLAARGFHLAHGHMGTLGFLTLAIFAGLSTLSGMSLEKSRSTFRIVGSAIAVFIVLILFRYLLDEPFLLGIGALIGFVGVLHAGSLILLEMKRNSSSQFRHAVMIVGTLFFGILFGFLYGLDQMMNLGIPVEFISAHPAILEGGFLVLASVVFAQIVHGRTGIGIQSYFFAGYGLVIGVGVAFDLDVLLNLSLPLFVVGTLLHVIVSAKEIGFQDTKSAHLSFSLLGIVGYAVFLVYIVVSFLSQGKAVPNYLFVASGHLVFLIIAANAMFAFMEQVYGLPKELFTNSHKIFVYGFNLSAILFVILLFLDLGGHMALVMGIFLLIGLAGMLKTLKE